MKIKNRLLLVVIPVVLLIFIATTVTTSLLSTSVLKNQRRENTQLFTANYASLLNGNINQYLNIAQELGSSMITTINVETTLKLFQRRYPEFLQVYYTSIDGSVSYLSPYSEIMLGYDFSHFEGWKEAGKSRNSVMSQADYFIHEQSVLIFAPCLVSFNRSQKASIEGYIVLQLSLDNLFQEVSELSLGDKEELYILDSQGTFLHHPDHNAVLESNLTSLSESNDWTEIQSAIDRQYSGFAIYVEKKRQNYLSFTPVGYNQWTLAIGGDYSTIGKEIRRINVTSILVILLGLVIGGLLLYLVIGRAIQPIEILTDSARSISRGEKEEIPLIESSSEIGILSHWMNSMVLQLRNHQQNLEQILDERTRELKRANEDLEETVEELNQTNEALKQSRETLEIRVEERTEDLKDAHLYIRSIINSIPSLLLALDGEGRVVQMNHAAIDRFQLSEENFTTPFWEFLPYLEEDKDEILLHLHQSESWEKKQIEHTMGQKTIIEDIGLFPLTLVHQAGAVLFIRDVSKETYLEENLRQSQKMEAIGQLAGGVAHDFNNMLAGIMGGAELLYDYMGEKVEAKEYLDMIVDTAEHASILTRKLLSFSHRGIRNPQPVDLNHIIIDVITLLGRTLNKDIEIQSSLSSDNPHLLADSSELHNLFLNLGVNSGHAMPDGGILRFETKWVILSHQYCRESAFDLKPGNYVEILVKDTGTGIKKEIQQNIFDPFFTTKAQGEGTGLGLSAVFRIVKQYGGEILLESEENHGTTFSLHFPWIFTEEVSGKELEIKEFTGGGSILLVDDEPVIRKSTQAMLERLGYQVFTAENGLQGVETFKVHQDRIDAVILDMIMPVMNGKDCFYAIRKLSPSVPVIIASGFAKEEELSEIKKLGIAGILIKPYKAIDLQSLLFQIDNVPFS